MPSLSIIVPTLNEEKNIENLLSDYLKQTKKADEFIIVDGGSTDKTLEIISDYMKREKTIRLVHCSKRGLPAARNMGVQNSRSEYVLNMDADWRLLSKQTISKIYEQISTNSDSYIFVITTTEMAPLSGLRKYFYLKDKNIAFTIVRASKYPKIDEELGFGEDRYFYKQLQKTNPIWQKLDDRTIPISRALGDLDLYKWMRRYMWYGRTMPVYLFKTRDFLQVIGYIAYILAVIFPFLLIIPFIRGFLKGVYEIKYGLDTPFGMGLIEILAAIGVFMGFLQWISGQKHIGRDNA